MSLGAGDLRARLLRRNLPSLTVAPSSPMEIEIVDLHKSFGDNKVSRHQLPFLREHCVISRLGSARRC